MTPITAPIVTTLAQQHRRDLYAIVATAAMLFSWAVAAHNLSVAQEDAPDARMERVMLAACKLPDNNGAATVYARVDGKIFCWRMK